MKKIICVLLMASLLIFNISTAFAVSTDEAMSLMNQLGIIRGYEDGDLRPDELITRAEFCAMLMRINGYESICAPVSETPFRDVEGGHWASGYITLAYNMGIISGYDGVTFGPMDNVTVNQAVKMLVSSLGYSVAAQKQGYPAGYLAQAISLDLLDGVETGEKAATRKTVARLLSNALEAPMMEMTINTKNESYVRGEGTLLGLLDVKVVKGLVDGIYGASLTGASALKEDEVSISGTVYKTALSSCAGFFTKTVEAYVKENEKGQETVLFMTRAYGTEGAEVIKAEDIDTDATTLSKIVWTENNKTYSEVLNSSMTYVYNGGTVATQNLSTSLLHPESGEVILADTNRDGAYDTVVIWSYETIVVTTVTDKNIYGRYSKYVNIEKEDDDRVLLIQKGGEKVEPSSLLADSVIWVAQSLDGEYTWIFVNSKESVAGTLEAWNTDYPVHYTVDGEEYRVAQSYLDAKANNSDGYEEISLGDKAIFLLDDAGKIVASDKIIEEGSGKERYYGYVTQVEVSGPMASTAGFRILTEDNVFRNIELDGRKKITFGRKTGASYSKTKMTAADIAQYMISNKNTKELISYSLGNDGEIDAIYLAAPAGDKDNFSLDNSLTQRYYSNGIIDQEFIADEETLLFRIPNGGFYEEDFSVSRAQLLLSNGANKPMTLYDVDNMRIGAIVMTDNTDRFTPDTKASEVYISNTNSPVMLVEKVYHKINDEGHDYMVIEGYEGDGKKLVLASDTLSANTQAQHDIKPGVIIQYQDNDVLLKRALYSEDDRVVEVYQKLFDCNDALAEPFQMWDKSSYQPQPNAAMILSFGTVSRYNMPGMILNTTRNGVPNYDVPIYIGDGTVIYCYDREEKKVEPMRHEDIHIGQDVFVWQRYNNTRMVVIIED